MCVHVCVGAHVCVCVGAHVCVYVCPCVHMRVCVIQPVKCPFPLYLYDSCQ